MIRVRWTWVLGVVDGAGGAVVGDAAVEDASGSGECEVGVGTGMADEPCSSVVGHEGDVGRALRVGPEGACPDSL